MAIAVGLELGGLLLAGCATTAVQPSATALVPAVPLSISQVGVEPKALEVHRQEGVTIRYQINHSAAVLIDLVDEGGSIVRQLDVGWQSAGLKQVRWDGNTAEGRLVPSGVYRYVIIAQGPSQFTVYDPSSETGGEELTPWDFVFDREPGTLRWVMPKAGYARLRVGIEGFPHLRTLLDWEPLEAGEQTVRWDGLDASGLLEVREHPNLSVKLSAFALPHNTIIVRAAHAPSESSSSPPFVRRASPPSYPSFHHPQRAYLHARHPRTACHEVRFRVEFPEATRFDQGRPILKGVVPVRVTLDRQDVPWLNSQRFEVALYEDLTFLFEEEEGLDPFTYLWDTGHLSPGEHLLTVNILSYDDHYGVQTVPVILGREG